MNVHLEHVELPDFGRAGARPELADETYRNRFAEFRRRLEATGFDAAVVYADREHSANLSFLSGFDPRFEEALLVVGPGRDPLLLTGNECVGMGAAAPLPMRVELHQEFSLPGQPRDRSRALSEVFRDEGLVRGTRVAAVGWKEMANATLIEVPAWIVDALWASVGESGEILNANSILTDAGRGMRVRNEIDQLAAMEYASTRTSSGVRDVLFGLQPGLREDDAVALLGWDGSPLSCHLMLSSGPRASLGLLSPTSRKIERGDRFTTAFGTWGALNCRAGFVVADATELPGGISDYVDRLVKPYFAAIVEWYESLHIGQTGDVMFEVIDRHLGDPFFGIFLNPGHQIHLDEWVNSPVFKGSDIELQSGMALQVDVIPATGSEYFTTNIEDGIALLDEDGREEFADRYPEAWGRIVARRMFMRDVIGIDLDAAVLPFSNIPAYLAPFLLDPTRAMVAT
ncbi:MAG: aminopeptidase P family N-terminal domain-containing protein [Acidimicrobiia bacterium]